jgi:heat shock protein HslJ
MYCEGKMHNKSAFFAKLNQIKNFEFQNEILTFSNENQEIVLKLKKQKS